MPKLWLTAKCSAPTARLDLVVLFAGELAVALGSVVLFGWYTHSPWLVQLQPTFAPMQYNAALSMLLCGVGLLALSWERVRLEVICGIMVAAIGLLTLYEYIFGLSLGLDQFFLQPFTTVRTSHPGRMAPQIVLCAAAARGCTFAPGPCGSTDGAGSLSDWDSSRDPRPADPPWAHPAPPR